MSNLPHSHAKPFLASPALSLSLAGIFRGGGATAEDGEGGRRTEEISNESSRPAKSDDYELAEHHIDDEDHDDVVENTINGNNKKKRKIYHRHTPDQIREMEALFKECPHPDEKQRQDLSKQLGLHPRQVKFWFQNRRTQIKAIQERHENTLLKNEIDKLRDENKALRDNINKPSCPNCGFATTGNDSVTLSTEDHRLRVQNARLKAEVEKLRSIVGTYRTRGTSPNTSSCPSSTNNDQEKGSSLDVYNGNPRVEKTRIMEAVTNAMDELIKMASEEEPLWIRSYETGREILNYDEYMKEFCAENHKTMDPKESIEASRESGVMFVDLPWLVQSFMDANQWQELFPCMVSKAATIDVICSGEGSNRDGAVHFMFAEIQMLTPMVATREVYFFRHCKKLSTNQWAIVDVSIDNNIEDNIIDASLQKCRKRPSGCIIEDKSNGHCKVTWVEHLECQKSTVHSLYRTIVSSGLAFGAKHWISTLQQQCERLVFLVATNVPIKDSSAGRKSILKLAQRMTWSFCKALAGGPSCSSWKKITSKTGDDIRVACRKNLNEAGEPVGTILSAVSCVWLPVSHHVLFDFLRDENRRNEWDIMSNGSAVQSTANLSKGQDRGNAVSILAMKTDEHNVLVLQDSCMNAYESTVVYAPVDINSMQSVMTGCDSSKIAVLPSGFAILPDGVESRPFLITSRPEEKNTDGGSLLTLAFQILISNSPTAKLSMDSVDSVNTLISCTLQNIKRGLQCED